MAIIPVEFGDWPGRVVHGVGTVSRLHDLVAQVGASRALVVCGATVAGGRLLERVRAGLGPAYAGVFAQVKAHTPVEMVNRGVEAFRETGADVIVSVGGGSAIDAGKAIAIMLATGGDLAPYAIRYSPGGTMEKHAIPGTTVPHIAVPTTAGSASDVMPTAGCRDPETRRKMLFWDAKLVPAATVLDPEMAVETNAFLSAATGMTAMARAVESVYSGGRHGISTGLALHAARLLHANLPRALAAPDDLDARGACQMAAVMSGMAAINAMVSVVHAIGHVIGGRHGLQHGISHSILLAPAMRRLLPAVGGDQTLLLQALGGAGSGDGDRDGREAADRIARFVDGLPLPKRLRDVGVTEGELAEAAHLTMSDYMMANLPRALDESEVLSLLREAW
jgi:alcohol dehydrogenase class IV